MIPFRSPDQRYILLAAVVSGSDLGYTCFFLLVSHWSLQEPALTARF